MKTMLVAAKWDLCGYKTHNRVLVATNKVSCSIASKNKNLTNVTLSQVSDVSHVLGFSLLVADAFASRCHSPCVEPKTVEKVSERQ